VDLFPLLCKIMGIPTSPATNGTLDVVGLSLSLTQNIGNSAIAVPLNVCYNTGFSSSSKYTCMNGGPYIFNYNDADCVTYLNNASVNGTNVAFNCNGQDCHAKVREYTKTSGSSEYCNYDTSNYLPPGTGDCNYFTKK